MYTDQVHFMFKQFPPIYNFFMAFNFPLDNCLNMLSFELFTLSVDTVHHTLLHTVVYGTHSADAGEREVNLLENWNIRPFA
jgi:hypothetical protein